jgi:hypothetical protein
MQRRPHTTVPPVSAQAEPIASGPSGPSLVQSRVPPRLLSKYPLSETVHGLRVTKE